MENTLENKARFFALHWGQKVLKVTPTQTESVGIGGWNLKHPDFFLELKPLSSITDEDRKVVSKIMQETDFLDSDYGALHTADYLRSKGYALPYMGLSVEKMIEYNWIKLV